MAGRVIRETQGKEERFHRTLAVELLQHRQFRDCAAVQAAFDAWRQVYNRRRPHEALGLVPPAQRYVPSSRPFLEDPEPPVYDLGDEVRRVSKAGYFAFRGRN